MTMHKEQLLGDTIFRVHELLTLEECQFHIDQSEKMGFADAPLGSDKTAEVFKEVRDNARVILDDPSLSAELYRRVTPFLPTDWFGWRPVGLNERWRYYRYDPGQRFAAHTDGCFRRENGEESQFTFMIWLNEDYTGGTTNFHLRSKQVLRVQPRTGSVLVFTHRQLHEGAVVESGRKYALRMDVMCAR
jgi:hypothetical protein